MDEENSNVNRLDTVLGVREDKSVGSKIKSFAKRLGKVPEAKTVDLIPRADFRKTNKELNKQLNKWRSAGKKHAGNPLVNYVIGNKHKVKATKRLFAELEKTAFKSNQKYQAKLNALLGEDRDKNKGKGFQYGGEIGDTRNAHTKTIQAISEHSKELKQLNNEYEILQKRKNALDLLPTEKTAKANKESAQKKLNEQMAKYDTAYKKSADGAAGSAKINAITSQGAKWNKEAAKLAAGYYGRTGDESLFDVLRKDIEGQTKEDEKRLADISAKLIKAQRQKAGYTSRLNALLKKQKNNPSEDYSDAISSTKANLEKVNNDVHLQSDEKKAAQKFVKLDKKRKSQFNYYYANKDKPQDFAKDQKGYNTNEFAPKLDNRLRDVTARYKELAEAMSSMTSSKELANIDADIQQALNAVKAAEAAAKNTRNETEAEDIKKQLDEKNKEIKKAEKNLQEERKAAEHLRNVFSDLHLEAKEIGRQISLWQLDLSADPFKYEMQSDDAKKYNGIIQDIKSGVAGIGNNWRKSNVFTRLGSRILLNIRSQIADMINPLTLFRKGWDAWLDRFDNLPWKNTFEVIGYNLVTAFEPVFKWLAQALIKVAQIANVFIKRWTGVDLFDKSAWQLEKIKKGMGQLTASFDELHSSNDNPNQFNTIFDTDPMAVSPLSEELTSKLEKWADRIANAFKWIKDNWLILVGLWAGFKLAEGLLGMLDWAKKLNNLFGTKLPGSFTTFLKGLGWVTAGISTVVSAYETIKLGNKWDQMDDKEKNNTIGKSIGFGTLAGGLIGGLIGGPAGAAIGAGIGAAITGGIDSAISDYNGDDARAEITGAIGGAGIGAAIGTLIAPGIGTAVGAAIGAGIGWGVEKLGHLTFSNGGDYSNLKISTEDLAWANEQLTTAQDNAYNSMYNLKLMEEQTGESGKKLYDSVQNGSLSLDNMTSSQLAVYKAYEQHMQILDELHKAQQTQMDYETSMDMDRAKKTDNYGSYIEKMIQANKDGIYSNDELEDRFAQMYGELDRGSRQAFLEQLPENMRVGVETAGREYMSNWSKFYDNCVTGWDTFKSNAVQMWEDVKTGATQKWEDFKTGAAETWENVKTTAGNIWNSIKIEAGETWENIKNSAIGQKVQEIATNVKTKWDELKTKTSETWENIKTKANTAWENIKNSSIGQKVQNIWQDTTNKFNDIKTKLSNDWNTLKTNASTAWNNIKNSIVDGAKNAWEGAKGFFSKIGEGIKSAWEGLKGLASQTGEKISNFVSGKGFKTNTEYEEYAKKHGINSYAVGTNYVPNDQLAMIHQGEAIIPKKYNKPYSPQSNNSELESTISAMTQEIANLRNLVQQGIPVKGEFRQRGSDLVAVVEKGKNKNGNQPLSNPAYAR